VGGEEIARRKAVLMGTVEIRSGRGGRGKTSERERNWLKVRERERKIKK
jgi:hypothetical protein